MFGVFKKIAVLWIFFVMIAIASGGGDRFRSLQGEAGWLTEKILDLLAAKADDLREEVDTVKERIQQWSGGKKDLARNVL
ncbi:MAG: hypothetical protein AB1805_14815 [Nitrospirota bacterium]